jgi:hypothetical protein
MDRIGEEIVIEERFCGPPRSGNGGYVCGRLAPFIEGPVAIRLTAPPPIGRALRVERGANRVRLFDGEEVIAEARAQALELDVPPAPSAAQAERASQRYLGFAEHNFPTCFVCGPERRAGDGLRIFPGALDDGARASAENGAARDTAPSASLLAALWTPDASLADSSGRVRSEFLWVALDCPGAFTRYPLPEGVALVLGELAVEQVGALDAGEQCVLTAWPLGDEGRRRNAGTALFRSDGSLVAKARAVWVEVPSQVWR